MRPTPPSIPAAQRSARRITLALLAAVAALALPAATGAGPLTAKFKLKPGAEGQVCLQCHTAFQEKLKKPAVHTPVKSKECIGCHNAHASGHGKLLSEEPQQVCQTCHQKVLVQDAASEHPPVRDGKCASCHDPHSSDNKLQLVQPGRKLCAGCHAGLVEQIDKAKVKHKPVEAGCQGCHLVHGSAASKALLTDSQPALCLSCHKADEKKFSQAHLGYPVAQAGKCTSCHDPHGSATKGMLFDTVHPPVAAKKCGQCHEEPTSKTPFATRRTGVDLCKGCHAPQLAQFLGQAQLHSPVFDERGCLNCHNPHASPAPKLVSGPLRDVCGKCHADTLARQERSVTKHKPIKDGDCAACHQPHGGAEVQFMKVGDVNEGCGKCHDYQKHSTHPIGPKFKDPRNRNNTVSCLSCHRAHGTEYQHMSPYPTTTDLCTKCHEKFKR